MSFMPLALAHMISVPGPGATAPMEPMEPLDPLELLETFPGTGKTTQPGGIKSAKMCHFWCSNRDMSNLIGPL